MDRLRLAVAGAGLIGRRHVEIIEASPACSLDAIADPSPDARAYADERGAPWFATLADLLDDRRPDGIIIATPNQLHVEQGLQCIQAGIPALVEKPVADTLASGLRLLEAATAANARILVGHHRCYSTVMARAVETIRAGTLGQIVAVVGTSLFYKAETEGYFDGPNAWRRQPGGGPVLINIIHEIGNLRALVGEIVEVQAMTANAARGFPVEDTAAMTFRFDNGALGTFMLSDAAASDRNWEHTSGEDKARFAAGHTDDDDCYLVCGTLGSLAIPTMRLQRYPSPQERSWHKPLPTSRIDTVVADPLVAQIDHFCDVIRGSAAPRVSIRDGVQNLRVVEAIKRAAETGSRIRLSAEPASDPADA